jgi:hypothetical protein
MQGGAGELGAECPWFDDEYTDSQRFDFGGERLAGRRAFAVYGSVTAHAASAES